MAERFEVKGFPTLKWFPKGSLKPETYEGGRDLDSLIGFVERKAGVKSDKPAPPPTSVTVLNSANLDAVTKSGKNVLLEIYVSIS
jgi:protein disulfide-isomerase A6